MKDIRWDTKVNDIVIVALDELYPNLAPGDFDLLLTEGIGQIYEDGAKYVDEKTIRSGWQNIFSTDGSVIYNE